ncbi:MAG: hypothetical protein FH749_12765 [Firmicutes bacterium]|nr:hypothetical protein [Bacillota bacterium]
MKKIFSFLTIFLTAVMLLSACSSGTPAVYATIDDFELTREEFEFQLNLRRLHDPAAEMDKEGQLQLLDMLIDEFLLIAEAERREVEWDEERAEKNYLDFRTSVINGYLDGSESRYQARLQEVEVKEEDLRRLFRDYEQILRLLDEVREAVPEPTEDEVQEYYNARRSTVFAEPERREVRHILINADNFPDEDLDDDELLERSATLADDLYNQLQNGADFAQLAEEYSVDISGEDGGYLGWLEKDSVVPEFGDAAFTMEVDEISEPIESGYGLHIIQVLDIEPSQFMPLDDELKEQIRIMLHSDAREARVEEFIAELAESATISKNFN